ncbi:protein ZBED8-like [Galendromus occidentalis]|uniref:Protein ZBED8-like n=1 Tax=Galendromus occidentalis TaxID=34638 RepID=A0AAJ7SEW7_9ACAR|nr:protein ZBED8-like [Galendromus occidentalis]
MSKKRNWSDDYVRFGFTLVMGKDLLPKAQCILCSTVFANTSLKPSKLETHFLKHGGEKSEGNDLESLRIKRARFDSRGTLPSMKRQSCMVDKPILTAPYQAARMIAKQKKAHTIGENLIKPLFLQMAETLIGKEIREKFEKVPMSNNIVRERINDMSEDILDQIVTDLKETPSKISLQLDESTDVSSCSQLLVFVRYEKNGSIREDLLLCRTLDTTTTAEDVRRVVKEFFESKSLDLGIIGSICTDGAPAMLGNKSGFCALMKQEIPGLQITDCFLHRHALAAKTLPSELNEVLNLSVKVINFIRGRALNHRLFKTLCESMESEHTILLYHTSVRWLSRGQALSRFFELQDEVKIFLKDQKSSLLKDIEGPMFLQRLAYLTDVFGLLNDLSISLQGRDSNMLIAKQKLKAFVTRLIVWRRRVEYGNLTNFPSLQKVCAEEGDTSSTVIVPEVAAHLDSLSQSFHGYFAPGDLEIGEEWILNPFSFDMERFSDDETLEDELIELRVDRALAMEIKIKSLEEFWSSIRAGYPRLAEKALRVLLPFATTYLCESGFSTLLTLLFELCCYSIVVLRRLLEHFGDDR